MTTQSRQTHRPPLRHVVETYVSITGATYTAKAGDRVIGVNRAGVVTVTLPTAQLRPGRIYTVKDESGAAATNNITVATEGSETIDGSATDVISTDYGATTYYSDGTNWFALPLLLTLSTTVSTQAHGDSAAGGNATTASKGDHKHAMPAAGGTTQATQSALEAETNEDSYPPPDLLKHSPGVAKAWCFINAAGLLQSPSYNIASVGDVGTGQRDINFTTAFSTSRFIKPSTAEDVGTIQIRCRYRIPSTTDVEMRVEVGDAAPMVMTDHETSHAFFGDQ